MQLWGIVRNVASVRSHSDTRASASQKASFFCAPIFISDSAFFYTLSLYARTANLPKEPIGQSGGLAFSLFPLRHRLSVGDHESWSSA